MTLRWIAENEALPPTWQALGDDSGAPGLLAVGPRVTLQRLDEAYRRGIFPWYGPGEPALWWAPDPRMVLPVAGFKVSRSLRKTLRRFIADPRCAVRMDADFAGTVADCAAALRDGQAGTWIVPEIMAAYTAWHRQGRAHSVETWIGDQRVGGLYGVAIGRMFFGESMFSRVTDASKVALAALVAFSRAHGITLIDCQQATRHLASLGACEMPRQDFEAHLAVATAAPGPTEWTYHPETWAHLGLAVACDAAAGPAALPPHPGADRGAATADPA